MNSVASEFRISLAQSQRLAQELHDEKWEAMRLLIAATIAAGGKLTVTPADMEKASPGGLRQTFDAATGVITLEALPYTPIG